VIGLPRGWEEARLGDLGREIRGSVAPDPGATYELYSVPTFPTGRPDVVAGAEIGSAKRQVAPGDVLICKINPRINRVWIVADASGGLEQLASPEYLVFRTGDANLARYLMWYLRSPRFRDWIALNVEGATGSHTRAKSGPVLDQRVPIPPAAEQRRIVAAIEEQFSRLDATDPLVRRSHVNLAAMRRSALVRTLSGNWDRVLVGDVASVDAGSAFKSEFFGGAGDGIRLLRGDNIEPGRLRWANAKTWPPSRLEGYEHLFIAESDIILAMDRPLVAAGLKLAPVRGEDLPALLVQRVARIRPSSVILTRFLHLALQLPEFVPHLVAGQTGTQLPHITLAGIRSFSVPLPSIEEQGRLVAQFDQQSSLVDRLGSELAALPRRTAALRRAILQWALSGRLASQDPADEPAAVLLGRIATLPASEPRATRKRRTTAA
jgi:type I restriction enzyme S subunit